MKKIIITSLLVSTSILGSLVFNNSVVEADAVNGVVTTTRLARLYNRDGKLLTTRALAAKTPWLTNQQTDLDGVGSVYQVATNEFVKADDVTFSHGHLNKGTIRVGATEAPTYNYANGTYNETGNKLTAYSAWQYNYTDNFAGKTWYQVANNTWINSDAASDATAVANTGTIRIAYAPTSGTTLWNGYGNKKSDTGKKLTNGSSWKFSEKVIDTNGDAWYQIGGNQWVSGAYAKVYNATLSQTSAEVWDPNFAALKVTKASAIYTDSNYNKAGKNHVAAGSILQVTSTVLDGNTIWYELSDSGWLPSSVVTPISAPRPQVSLNGKSKSQMIEDVITAAKQQLGKPYVWNGKGPDNFDCSGLMQYVFRQASGQNIGSWTVPQEAAGTRVSVSQLQRGDLVFWGTPGASYHVGLYLGDNQYLNALRPGTNVKIDHISTSFAPSFGVRIFK